jgi:hypothetical protein
MLPIAFRVATDYSIELWLRTKVQNKPELEISRLQIVVKLASCGLVDLPDRLRFYDQSFVHNQVESLGSQFLPFVQDMNRYFPRHSVSSLEELPLKRRYVKAFEKPEPKVVVNLIKSSNHRMGELPLEEFDACHKQRNVLAGHLQSPYLATEAPIAAKDDPEHPCASGASLE